MRSEGNSLETFLRSSRYPFAEIPESNMDQKKKHDLRDDVPARTSITNTDSRMAGGADNPNVSTDQNSHLVKPGAQNLPNGQDVKGS